MGKAASCHKNSVFSHKRSNTFYGFLHPKGKRRNNGPHVTGHQLNKMFMSKIANKPTPIIKRSIKRLINTRIIPTVGQNRALAMRAVKNLTQLTPEQQKGLQSSDTQYKKNWEIIVDPRRLPEAKLRAVGKSLEQNPFTTYAAGREATSTELAAKGGEDTKSQLDKIKRFGQLEALNPDNANNLTRANLVDPKSFIGDCLNGASLFLHHQVVGIAV